MNVAQRTTSHARPTYSFINKSGEVVIDATLYQGVRSFSEGLAAVWLPDQGWGFIDKDGKVVITPQYQSVRSFSEGLAAVQIKGQWGFIDREGQVVIRPQYEVANSFSEGVAIVRKPPLIEDPKKNSDESGFREVKYVRTTETKRSDLASRSLAAQNGEVLLIDTTGQSVFSKKTKDIQFEVEARPRYSGGLVVVYEPKTKKYGYLDKTGNLAIEPKYSHAASFSEGLARVAVLEGREEKLGFVNRSGQFVILPRFNTDGDFDRNSTDFSEGLASLSEGLNPTRTERGHFAYIDKQGNIVLATRFSWAGPFREGLAAVYDDRTEKWGYIDETGKLIIPTLYELADAFSDGLALVTTISNTP